MTLYTKSEIQEGKEIIKEDKYAAARSFVELMVTGVVDSTIIVDHTISSLGLDPEQDAYASENSNNTALRTTITLVIRMALKAKGIIKVLDNPEVKVYNQENKTNYRGVTVLLKTPTNTEIISALESVSLSHKPKKKIVELTGEGVHNLLLLGGTLSAAAADFNSSLKAVKAALLSYRKEAGII